MLAGELYDPLDPNLAAGNAIRVHPRSSAVKNNHQPRHPLQERPTAIAFLQRTTDHEQRTSPLLAPHNPMRVKQSIATSYRNEIRV